MNQRRQLIVLIALLLVAGNVWYWFYFRQKTAATSGDVAVVENYQLIPVENPSIRWDEMEKARTTEYKSDGSRNIFSAIPPPPPAPKVPVPDRSTPVGPPVRVVPTVTPLPVKFFGYGTVPNGTLRRAFFTDGEDVYIVSEGEVLMNRFRIIKVNNASLDYEEVSSGLHGTANLEDQGATPAA